MSHHGGARPRSLNASISWENIVDIFELPTTANAFPCRTICPFCKKNRFYVFDDPIQRGHFHYCACGCSSGDMIELAAKLWKLPIKETITKLGTAGYIAAEKLKTVKAIDRYERLHLIRRHAINDVWERARVAILGNTIPAVTFLKNKFCLQTDISRARWLAGPGQVVGATTAFTIEEALWPKLARPSRGSRGGGLTNNKSFFVGDNWREVLMLPHHDMPDRICGLTCVGRRGTPTDILYAPIERIAGHRGQPKQDGGLVGLGVLAHNDRFTKEHVVVINDPLLVARAQVRHTRMSFVPLMLLACREDRHLPTMTAWRCLDTKHLVHWGWHMTPALLYRAILTDAELSLSGPHQRDDASIAQYLRTTAPGDMVSIAVKSARYWPEALSRWAEAQQDSAVEALFLGLKEYNLDVGYLIDEQLNEGLRDRVKRLLNFQPLERAARYGARDIIERRNCWFVRDRHGCVVKLTDFVIRVDAAYAVVGSDGKDVPYFKGKILSGDQIIPFNLTVGTFYESRLMEVISKLCKRTVFVLPGYVRRILAISKLFQQPVY